MATFSKQTIDRRLVLSERNRHSHKGLGNQVERLQEMRRKAKEPTILAGALDYFKANVEKFEKRLMKFKAKGRD